MISTPISKTDPVETPLPVLASSYEPNKVVDSIDALSRAGKLPEFERGATPGTFSCVAFGNPFDYTLFATAEPNSASTGSRLRFDLKMRQRLPLIFTAIIIVSIWPGVPLTDSLLRSYFDFYTFPVWVTWAWYIPLTILPLLWMIPKQLRQSRAAAHASAIESIEIIAEHLGHTV